MMQIVGVDTGTKTIPEAEHALREIMAGVPGPGALVACTHFIRDDEEPHVALSLTGPGELDLLAAMPGACGVATAAGTTGPARLAAGAEAARVEAAARSGGRAVVFRGVDLAMGEVPVRALLDGSLIDRVEVVGGPPAGPDALLRTRDFVRPVWSRGALILQVTAHPGGTLAPFEVPDPTPCCADHA
jgi:hypothetical protein